MIKLTKLNGGEIYINPDLMSNIECLPNTIVHMTTGEKIIVKETPEKINDLIVEYRRKIYVNGR